MASRVHIIALVGLIFFIVLGGLTWRLANYRECRAFGHSVMYCLGR
jgi:hypothetical protein